MGALKIEPISKRCAVCKAPVAISPVGRPRLYCSNRCRQKAARIRQILVGALTRLELLNVQLAPAIDWSDEDHRVA